MSEKEKYFESVSHDHSGEMVRVEDLARGEWFKKEEFEMNGKKVILCGVIHAPETFEAHRKDLEEEIQKASIIVLEGAPKAAHMDSPRVIRMIKSFLEKKGVKASENSIAFNIVVNPNLKFFSKVEGLAQIHGKRIVTVDPGAVDEEKIALHELQKRDEEVQAIKLLSALGGILGLGTLVLTEEMKKSKRKEKKNPSTRRTFLKGLFGFLGGVGIASRIASQYEEDFDEKVKSYAKKGILSDEEFAEELKKGRIDNPLGALLYDWRDFRNVGVAKGLEALTKRSDLGDGPIVMIYGDSHRRAIEHYALSPREREAKYVAYAPYHDIAPLELRIYEPKDEDWVLKEKQEL